MSGFPGLFIPGPTNMPFGVRQAMDIALEDQRSPDFPAFTLPLFADLKKVFKTEKGQVFLFPGSGTGGWEAAITNTLSPGDHVLIAVFGQFSHLWADLCNRHELVVDAVQVEWGEGVPVDIFAQKLAADKAHKIKAVLVCHNETATGVTSDVAGVRKALDAVGSSGLADGRRRELDRQHRFPHGRMGRRPCRVRFAERLHAADRARHRRGQPEGAGSAQDREMPALLLRFRGHDPHQQGRIFSLHAGDDIDARLARVDRHAARRGTRERVRAASSHRASRAPRRRSLGADALRQGAEMAFRHGDGDLRAEGLQQR